MRIKIKHIDAAREVRQWVVLIGTVGYIFLSNDGDKYIKAGIAKIKKGVKRWLA